MMPQRFVRSIALAAALTASFSFFSCSSKPPEHGTLIDKPEAAPVLHVTDANGHVFDLAAQHEKLTLLYFGYTHCPDACPTTLTDWARAKALLGAKGNAIQFVFVSVDPERDTPQISATYARQFDSSFVGLTAAAGSQLDAVKAAWSFAVERDEMPGMKMGEYGLSHPAGVYFIDRDGKFKFVFAPGSKPEELASDIKRLM